MCNRRKHGKHVKGGGHSPPCFLSLFRLSRILYFTMSASGDRAYSTLEAIPQQHVDQTYRHQKPLPTDPGKQVAPESGKQVTLDDGKQHIGDSIGIEVAAKEDFYAHDLGGQHAEAYRPSRRKWMLFVGAVGLIAILAAVLGGVIGSRHKSSATASLTGSLNSSATPPPTTPPQRNIAAISFASKSVNNSRVYFQDNVGQIMEAANSADNGTWSIKKTGIGAKNGSAIAAAVSRPGFPLVSHVSSTSVDAC